MQNNLTMKQGGIVGNIRTCSDEAKWASVFWNSIPMMSRESAASGLRKDVISSHDGVVINGESIFTDDTNLFSHIYNPSSPPRRGGFISIDALGLYIEDGYCGGRAVKLRVDSFYPGNKQSSLSTTSFIKTLVCSDDIMSAYRSVSTMRDTRGGLSKSAAETILTKLMTIFPDNWEEHINRAVDFYLNYKWEQYVQLNGISELHPLNSVPEAFLRDVIIFLASYTDYIPLKDLGLYALSDTMVDDLADYVQGGEIETYFDKYSLIDTINDYQFHVTKLDGDKPAPFLHGIGQRQKLLASEQSLIVSCVKDSPAVTGIAVNDVIRAAAGIVADKVTPSPVSRITCDKFTFFKHHTMSDHLFVLPDLVREYTWKNTVIPMKPIVHEFLRRGIVHLRCFSKMEDGKPAPIDVACNLAPILVVGKALQTSECASTSKLEKIICMLMSMYTNGVVPKDVVNIWKERVGVSGISDAEAFDIIYNSIDKWVKDDVVGKVWHTKLYYNQRMAPYYEHGRLAGCLSARVYGSHIIRPVVARLTNNNIICQHSDVDALIPALEKADLFDDDSVTMAPPLPPRDTPIAGSTKLNEKLMEKKRFVGDGKRVRTIYTESAQPKTFIARGHGRRGRGRGRATK